MSGKFVFMAYAPAAAKVVAKPKADTARSPVKADVLETYGKVSIPDDGDWYVAAVDLHDIPAIGKAKAKGLSKYNPYILLTREEQPKAGTSYMLPLAWNGCRYMSRKVAINWAHAFNFVFKG